MPDFSDTTRPAAGSRIDIAPDGTAVLSMSGAWVLGAVPPLEIVMEQLRSVPAVTRLAFDSSEISHWDTGILVFLVGLKEACDERGVSIDASGLPQGARRLVDLATAVPEKTGTGKHEHEKPLLTRIGETSTELFWSGQAFVEFLGESVLSLLRLLSGKARFPRSDFLVFLESAGPRALPIVTLISFLVGFILAFVGAAQLEQFGATIYVANLVGIAMTTEMGAMMTAIIMTGRTGAAYAAELGTMTVNEEIDALRTTGISPMDYLVLPRLLALAIMMPLLTLFSDFVGMLGGAVISALMLPDVSFSEYLNQTANAVTPQNFAVGLGKGAVYGVLVALAGCMRGMQCGRSASAVGSAVTSAVVLGIVLIIGASAIMTIVLRALGI